MEDNEKLSSFNGEIIINDFVKGHIVDIDEQGVFINTQADFLLGATLDLTFAINEHRKIRGTIRQITPGVGIRVDFLDLLPSDLFWIKKVMTSQSKLGTKESAVKKILLVDDNAQIRSAYGHKLLEAGFEVTEAQSGTEAFVRIQETHFDLVILDLWIEGVDGFKLLNIIRSKPHLQKMPVIIFSARNAPPDIEKAKALGATEYLVKTTTTPIDLAARIREILSQ
jgi:CheY-like chemotaxis protein